MPVVGGLLAVALWEFVVRPVGHFVWTFPQQEYLRVKAELDTLETKNEVYRQGQRGLLNDIAKRDAELTELRPFRDRLPQLETQLTEARQASQDRIRREDWYRMANIVSNVNGHSVSYTRPAQQQDYATWHIRKLVSRLHQTIGLSAVKIHRETAQSLTVTIELGDRSWVLTFTFDNGSDPITTFNGPGWRMSEFAATRELRDEIIHWIGQGAVDDAEWVVE